MSEWVLVTTSNTAANPRHHLWRNKDWWYLRVTMHNTRLDKSMSQLHSLRTKDIDVAMRRRDKVLATIIQTYGHVVRRSGGCRARS